VLQIRGLVREFDRVRSQLRDGIPPEEVDVFRKRVIAVVHLVEDMCRRHATSPDRLPLPSRAAYRFLKDLDLTNLPLAPSGSTTSAQTIRLRNILAVERHLAEKMWVQLPLLLESSRAAAQVKSEIARNASTIEAMCSRSGVGTWMLQLPSRRVYCWLKFLADQDNLDLHLHALQRARGALADVEPQVISPSRLLLIHMQALWSRQPHTTLLLVKASEGFVGAGEAVWGALLRGAAATPGRADDELVREFVHSDDFSEILVEIEGFAEPPAESKRGRVHSLDDSFDRVNHAYFADSIPRPLLKWNRILTGRKFGHYRQSRDTVMLSVSLDDGRVPSYVVDFVMYHELLHKKHGALLVNGRRLVHTPAFRAEERLFTNYEDAQRHLDALAQGGGLSPGVPQGGKARNRRGH